MENTSRRDGRRVEELGYYNPRTKQSKFDLDKVKKWSSYGVKPTRTVSVSLQKSKILS